MATVNGFDEEHKPHSSVQHFIEDAGPCCAAVNACANPCLSMERGSARCAVHVQEEVRTFLWQFHPLRGAFSPVQEYLLIEHECSVLVFSKLCPC